MSSIYMKYHRLGPTLLGQSNQRRVDSPSCSLPPHHTDSPTPHSTTHHTNHTHLPFPPSLHPSPPPTFPTLCFFFLPPSLPCLLLHLCNETFLPFFDHSLFPFIRRRSKFITSPKQPSLNPFIEIWTQLEYHFKSVRSLNSFDKDCSVPPEPAHYEYTTHDTTHLIRFITRWTVSAHQLQQIRTS